MTRTILLVTIVGLSVISASAGIGKLSAQQPQGRESGEPPELFEARQLSQRVVDEAGKVINARATCGPGLLIGAAVSAARQWIFTPTMLSGAPVKVIGAITFNFTL